MLHGRTGHRHQRDGQGKEQKADPLQHVLDKIPDGPSLKTTADLRKFIGHTTRPVLRAPAQREARLEFLPSARRSGFVASSASP